MRQRNPIKTAITAVIALVVLLMVLTAQLNYTLTDQGIMVTYRYLIILPESKQLIEYDTIQDTEVLPQLPPMRRMSGIDMFGRMHIGRYRSDAIGEFRAYVKNARGPQLVIRTSDKTYVISPEEVEVFANQINERIKR